MFCRWVSSKDLLRAVFLEKSPEHVENDMFLVLLGFPILFVDLGSKIEMLGSERVYLHEECGTDPSRHLRAPKTAIGICIENNNNIFIV